MTVKSEFQSKRGSIVAWHKAYNASVITTLPPTVSQEVWYDTKTGIDLPNWRERIRQGRNATTTYSVIGKRKWTIDFEAEAITTRSDGRTYIRGFRGHHQSLPWDNLGNPALRSALLADQLARQRFVSKYREARTAFESGVFFGELMETVRMIRRPAQALRGGINDYYRTVKKRLRKSKNRRRVIQDTWLEAVFGWKPLLHDIEDACRLATVSPTTVFEVIKAGHRDEQTRQNQKRYFAYPSNLQLIANEQLRGWAQVTYKGAVRADNQPPNFPEQLGLSWSNVLPTVWELIPYSFLVDYFTNVGKVIEGISTGKIRLAWGCRSELKHSEREILSSYLDWSYLNNFTPVGGSSTGYASGAGMVESATVYNRSPVTSVSVGLGDFLFKLPGSGTKWLNIAALAKLRR